MTVGLLCPSHSDTAFNVQAASQSVEGAAVAEASLPLDTGSSGDRHQARILRERTFLNILKIFKSWVANGARNGGKCYKGRSIKCPDSAKSRLTTKGACHSFWSLYMVAARYWFAYTHRGASLTKPLVGDSQGLNGRWQLGLTGN